MRLPSPTKGLGLYRESVILFAKVQELRTAVQGPLDTGTIESMSDLASACESAGQLDKAISLNEEVLNIQQCTWHPMTPQCYQPQRNWLGLQPIGPCG